ncbi:MAG: protein-L-isoaspartate(D-aspartate) O-methyltransferase [Kiritimatiellae bacterium]|nr:protein-L-isoaspartate(D-aspartate) O-methyltransferase [Kiritimatiellia bacterium]
MSRADAAALRAAHVSRCIAGRGIRDPRVLHAMSTVPRERFVPDVSLDTAYADCPLPIACDQTISQPYIVAWMTEALALKPEHRVLEIGTGSGYQAAVLAMLVDAVYTVEYHAALSKQAEELLKDLGFTNVRFRVGDGSLGWEAEAPFDGICVTAAAPEVPPSLVRQLRDGGRLVIPTGGRFIQDLVLIEKRGNDLVRTTLGGCRFVPLRGKEGWR